MDRHALADELRSARFRTTAFRQGYDEGAVDDAIDVLVQQLLAGVPDHEIVGAVQAARFATTSGRRGYDMADVDTALERVTTALDPDAGTRTSLPDGAPTHPGAALPSAVSEPPRGFLARLLGR